MGGAKKPTAAKKDKPKDAKDSKKGKKDKGEGGPRKCILEHRNHMQL